MVLAILLCQAICSRSVLAEDKPYNQTRDFSMLLISDTKHMLMSPQRWGTQEWRDIACYTAGVGVLMVLDKSIYDVIGKNRSNSLDSFAYFVQEFGSSPSFGIMGAFYAGGLIYNDSRAKSVAVDAFASSLVSAGIVTPFLKFATGRSRPWKEDGTYHFQPFSGNDSFPSGHTTQAFALASCIAEHYDEQWIDITSYGIATLVGFARIEQKAHFPSDVLAGAIIGTVVGKSIVRYNKEQHEKYTLLPLMDGQTTGIMLRVKM